MNREDRVAERHVADVFAMTTRPLLPAKNKAPRQVRFKNFVEGYLTTKWIIRSARTLLGGRD